MRCSARVLLLALAALFPLSSSLFAQIPDTDSYPAAWYVDEELTQPTPPSPETTDEVTGGFEAEKLQPQPESPPCCKKNPCDKEKMQELNKAVAGAYEPVFYDNNFSYLDDPCYDDWWPGQHFKQINLCDWATLDVGGQYRNRYHSEHHMRGLGLTGVNDDFLLHRTRVYGNLQVDQFFRAYVEYIDAVSNYERHNPRPIEENRSDLLNAFADVLLLDTGSQELWFRGGRQELIYGQQRAVSPLDWANTRRTFQGYKAMLKGENWKIDGFWTNPIDPEPKSFDNPNRDEQFMGVYATRAFEGGETLDLFYLRLQDAQNQGSFPNDFDFHTLGGRLAGKYNEYDYEAWGGYQFGKNTNGSGHAAGAFTFGIGRTLQDVQWTPSLWIYYDWASGANDTGAGNGYHHLFPLAHKYLGFMDLYGRRNIQSPNVLFQMQPAEKVKLLLWYYYFQLQNGNDTPYSVVMTPFNPNNRPGSRDLGHEIDFLVTYNINVRMSLLLGYSHFFAGDYYRKTPGVPTSKDADFTYVQFQFDF